MRSSSWRGSFGHVAAFANRFTAPQRGQTELADVIGENVKTKLLKVLASHQELGDRTIHLIEQALTHDAEPDHPPLLQGDIVRDELAEYLLQRVGHWTDVGFHELLTGLR